MLEPEKIIMLSIAIAFDTVGELIPYISDFLAILIIGGWILFRSGQKGLAGDAIDKKRIARKGMKSETKKISKWAKRVKWLRPLAFIGELVPVISVIPFLTLLVWAELQD